MRALFMALLVSVTSAAAVEGGAFNVRFTPFEVLPNQDRLVCEYVELPEPTTIDVARFVIRSRPRIHHVALEAYVGQDRDPRLLTGGRHLENLAA